MEGIEEPWLLTVSLHTSTPLSRKLKWKFRPWTESRVPLTCAVWFMAADYIILMVPGLLSSVDVPNHNHQFQNITLILFLWIISHWLNVKIISDTLSKHGSVIKSCVLYDDVLIHIIVTGWKWQHILKMQHITWIWISLGNQWETISYHFLGNYNYKFEALEHMNMSLSIILCYEKKKNSMLVNINGVQYIWYMMFDGQQLHFI